MAQGEALTMDDVFFAQPGVVCHLTSYDSFSITTMPDEAISSKIQNLALYGIKKEKLLPPSYGPWFHLLLYLAWHGWNVSIQGEDGFPPSFEEGIKEIKRNCGITDKDIKKNFISRDARKVALRMAEAKREKYPDDHRIIRALEFTEQGALRVYAEGREV
jgi:hypothetical protein